MNNRASAFPGRTNHGSKPLHTCLSIAIAAVLLAIGSGLAAQQAPMPGEQPQGARIQRVPVETTQPVFTPPASPAAGESDSARRVAQAESATHSTDATASDEGNSDSSADDALIDPAQQSPDDAAAMAEGDGAADDEAGTIETLVPEDGTDRELFTALMAAEFSLQDGRVESAAKHYARAALLSSDPKVAEQAARIALQAGRSDLAEASLRRWRELAPEAGSALQGTDAGVALAKGDVEGAVTFLRPLLAGSEDDRRALVQVLLAPGSREHLGATLDALAAGAGHGGADGLVLLSQIADQIKDRERASRLADTAVAEAPDESEVRVWRAHLRFAAKDIKGGRADMDRALASGEDKQALRFNYAAMLSTAGDHKAADAMLRDLPVDDAVLAARAAYAARSNDDARLREVYAALEQLPEPRSPERIELLANLAELLDNDADALRWYRTIAATDERFLASQMRVALLRNKLGERTEAVAMLRDLRAAGIDDPEKLAESYMLEAEILREDGKPTEVLAVYDRAIQLLPEQRQLGYGRAVFLESIGRVEDSITELRKMLIRYPDDPDALNALGYTLADRTEKHDEALELIRRALELKPDEPAIVDSMGWALYRVGRNDEALVQLQRAWDLRPDPEVGAHLGELLWVRGDESGARRIWKEAAERDADNKVLAETRKRLDR